MSAPDPKIVRVIIKETVKQQLKEIEEGVKQAQLKQQPSSKHTSTTSSSKKEARGASLPHGASLKNKSQKAPRNSPGNKNKDLGGGKSKQNKNNDRKKQGGKNKSQKTKKSKSNKALNRK